ncbi:DUF2612 domain-containing protein [Methylorubrum suomiense]
MGTLVDREMSRIATQYREATRLRGYMTAFYDQLEEAARATCDIPNHFDLNTARGEQLTWIGKRMGVPRCHCVCTTKPVFGFACEDNPTPFPITGFCEDGIWQGCGGVSDLCLTDDEVFRAHLKARRYQMLGLFDLESLCAAVRQIWGATAWIPQASAGQVVLAPGRDLTQPELERLVVTLRILPIAPGIRIAMHYGAAPIFGFGTGWAGFCDSVPSQPVFGFDCPDTPSARPVVGFCDDSVWVNCAPPVVPAGFWLCPVAIDPYACP